MSDAPYLVFLTSLQVFREERLNTLATRPKFVFGGQPITLRARELTPFLFW